MEPREYNPPQGVAELLRRYQAGERRFTDLEIDEVSHDLRGVTLEGADLSRSWLQADFRGANLRGVRFHRCNVKTCDFRGADLTGADFTESAIDSADFLGAVITDADFTGAGAYSHILLPGEMPIT